jgi:hypothetical protein
MLKSNKQAISSLSALPLIASVTMPINTSAAEKPMPSAG